MPSHMTPKPRKPIKRKPRVFRPLPFGCKLTEAELQAIVRGNPKPKPGSARAMQRARARLAKTRERAAKDAAKLRDGHACRVPGCRGLVLHAMHIRHAGMGGDPTGIRGWQRSDYVTGCAFHHNQQHAGYFRFQVGETGGDGRVWFCGRLSLTDPWTHIGWSEPPK